METQHRSEAFSYAFKKDSCSYTEFTKTWHAIRSLGEIGQPSKMIILFFIRLWKRKCYGITLNIYTDHWWIWRIKILTFISKGKIICRSWQLMIQISWKWSSAWACWKMKKKKSSISGNIRELISKKASGSFRLLKKK